MKRLIRFPCVAAACLDLAAIRSAPLPQANVPATSAVAPPAADFLGLNNYPVKPYDAAQQERLAWFTQARFGLFIHWGLYALPAGRWPATGTRSTEWIMLGANLTNADYEPLAAQFNPVKFNAREWVAVAKSAGMKYLVITAKHHDGFSMYATKASPYNIVDATPFKRDPLKELAAACKEAGLVFCVYYSIADWHHPDSPAQYSQLRRKSTNGRQNPEGGFHGAPNPNADVKKYAAYMHTQVRELLTNYGPIGIVWFDGGGAFPGTLPNRGELLELDALEKSIHDLQPAALINNRLGVGADYGTPEQRIPSDKAVIAPFEVCMPLNGHWGYNQFDHNWKSPATVVRNIADIVSKGGNYLLDVGPTAEGLFPAESVRILKEVGQWTSANAEAIYGAGPTPFGAELEAEHWRCTTQPGQLYFHLLKWPAGSFVLPKFPNRITKACLLAGAQRAPLAVSPGEAGMSVALPAGPPSSLAPVLCVEIEGAVTPSGAQN